MLIGVPGSGKTTWIRNHQHDAVILSTDDKIEAEAERVGLTYSDVFHDTIKRAIGEMNTDLIRAIRGKRDIIWDQTNLTRKSRAAKLSMVPDDYEKIAVFFSTPDRAELKRRLDSRPGKTIPANVILGMVSQLQPPSKEEGFDSIVNA